MFFIGLDDTDTTESRGTGHLARQIAATLAADYPVLGVTRHQLLVDPRVPCTKNNSCAAIALGANGDLDPQALLEKVRGLMLDDFQPGSDPGLCVTRAVPLAISEFGRRVQRPPLRDTDLLQSRRSVHLPLGRANIAQAGYDRGYLLRNLGRIDGRDSRTKGLQLRFAQRCDPIPGRRHRHSAMHAVDVLEAT